MRLRISLQNAAAVGRRSDAYANLDATRTRTEAPLAVACVASALLLRSGLGRSLLSETAYLSFPQPPRLVVHARPLGSRAAPERDPGDPFPADSSLHSRPAPPLRIRTYATPAAARACAADLRPLFQSNSL